MQGDAAKVRYRQGDRVEIVNPEHPWHGHTGHIAEPFRYADLRWSVELEGGDYPGQRAAVADADIRRRERGI